MFFFLLGCASLFAYLFMKNRETTYSPILFIFAFFNLSIELYLQYYMVQLSSSSTGYSADQISWLGETSPERRELLLYQHISFGLIRLLASIIGIGSFIILTYIIGYAISLYLNEIQYARKRM